MKMETKNNTGKNNAFQCYYKQIYASQIYVPEYQRVLSSPQVKRIVADFNPNLLNPIKVSYRGGVYYCFDGQHTLAALRMLNNGEDVLVDCKVYIGMSKEDEAELFAEQNGHSRKVEKRDELKALYIAKNETVVKFKTAVEKHGISCDFTASNGDGRLVSYNKALTIFKKSPDALDRILTIVSGAWNSEHDSLRNEMLGGLYVFDKTYGDKYSLGTAIKKFSNTSAKKIIRDAKATPITGDKRYAAQLVDLYNMKLTGKNRLEKELLWSENENNK